MIAKFETKIFMPLPGYITWKSIQRFQLHTPTI